MLNQNQLKILKDLLKCFTLHWTAGTWGQVFPDYHFCITFDGKDAHLKQTHTLMEPGAHTLRRNTGNIGISLCGMVSTHYYIQGPQIELASKLIAELCILLEIKPDGTYMAPELDHKTFERTGKFFKAPVIADHCYYAEKDGYGPSGTADRWDIGDPTGKIKFNGHIVDLLPVIYKKSIWYYAKLKSGQIQSEYTLDLR